MDTSGAHALNFAKLGLAYVIELANEGTVVVEPNVLENNVPATGLAAGIGADVRYTLDVPAGSTNIAFNTSGGTGDGSWVGLGLLSCLDDFMVGSHSYD